MKYTLTAPTINATIEGAVSVGHPDGGTTFYRPYVGVVKGAVVRRALKSKA